MLDSGERPQFTRFFFGEILGNQSRPRVWKRLRLGVSSVREEDDDAGGMQLQDHLAYGAPTCS